MDDIFALPLSAPTKSLLRAGGFACVRDVLECQPLALADELQVPQAEAVRIRQAVLQYHTHAEEEAGPTGAEPAAEPAQLESHSAAFTYQQRQKNCPIVTFCQDLDQMLGGGVQVGSVTEFCGEPGVGKTQLALQLAVDCQVPRVFGGAEGEAIYIDTEGSFHVERVAQIAQAVIDHLRQLVEAKEERAKRRGNVGGGRDGARPALREALDKLSLESILSRIHYYRVHSYAEQLAVLRSLPDFIAKHNAQARKHEVEHQSDETWNREPPATARAAPRHPLRLVVVDSVAFHFRHSMEQAALRTRRLLSFAQVLNTAASKFGFAAVVVNQVTTRIGVAARRHSLEAGGTNATENVTGRPGGARIVPALGEAWSHACTHRIFLFWGRGGGGDGACNTQDSRRDLRDINGVSSGAGGAADACGIASNGRCGSLRVDSRRRGPQRLAWLEKSPDRPPVIVPFCICKKGVRGADAADVDGEGGGDGDGAASSQSRSEHAFSPGPIGMVAT